MAATSVSTVVTLQRVHPDADDVLVRVLMRRGDAGADVETARVRDVGELLDLVARVFERAMRELEGGSSDS